MEQKMSDEDEFTQEELGEYFNNLPKEDFAVNSQNLEELKTINEWEEQQDNSNDLYKIKARVANLARANGASITPVGEMMVNTFVHVLKSLYDFADTIEDKNIRIKLIQKIRSHEGMPATLINAASVGVKPEK